MNIYFNNTNQRTFGTFPLRGKELTATLTIAVDIGYRSIDTAQMYRNEADIGTSLVDLRLPRNELCITTKVHPDNFGDDTFVPSVEKSLEKLRLDYVDVLLLHWLFRFCKSAGQIVLRWVLQKGVSIITMSTQREHIRANFDVMDFTLSSVDMSRIDAITTTNRRLVDKNAVPWAPTWD